MPRTKKYDDETLIAIGDEVLKARPDPNLSKRNTPWKLLEWRFEYAKSQLWRLHREALARRDRVLKPHEDC